MTGTALAGMVAGDIVPLAETPDTVTLRRVDFEVLLQAADDAGDMAAVEAGRAHETELGIATAKAGYLTSDEARQLLDGMAPTRVWRLKRGLSQRALAGQASVSVSYLAEIEGGKKGGSAAALARLGAVLDVSVEDLLPAPPDAAHAA